MKPGGRWAGEQGLATGAKKRWEISVKLETTGELPDVQWTSGKRPWLWLKIIEEGFWVELGQPLPNRRGTLHSRYVSWLPKKDRWHQWTDGPEKRVKQSQKLEPPKTLASFRKWLTYAEGRLGLSFRRDRPGIQSNIKGGAKAMAAWIGAS